MKWMQTKTIFSDAYRELNAKKLFWITLILTLLVVAVLAMLGVDQNRGVTFLWMSIPGTVDFVAQLGDNAAPLFYKFIIVQFGLGLWLTWVAAILALISTASIVPDLVQAGAIDTMLSKPMSRTRLFLTKLATGLLFAGLQVGVFVVGCLLLLGIRGGEWEWRLLLAIPIVLIFFSYLFSFCALLGLITKSTIAALLLTLLGWFGLFSLNLTDGILLGVRSSAEYQVEYREAIIGLREHQIAELEAERQQAIDAGEEPSSRLASRIQRFRNDVAESGREMESARNTLEGVEPWYDGIFVAKTLLPKTSETIALLERQLIEIEELEAFMGDANGVNNDELDDLPEVVVDGVPNPANVPGPNIRTAREYRSRSIWWIIGTSLAFEAVILFIATVIFARRDF